MIRLVYMSHAVKPFSTDQLMTLLRECRHGNAEHGITGVLLYFNECFIQVLEGHTAARQSACADRAICRRETSALNSRHWQPLCSRYCPTTDNGVQTDQT